MSNLEKLGKTLSQRLLEHAELHASLIDADSSEQRRFADDLREAAEVLARFDDEAAQSLTNSLREAAETVERLSEFAMADAVCPCCEASDSCEVGCTFSIDCPGEADRMDSARMALSRKWRG
jgi:hypothetical protein